MLINSTKMLFISIMLLSTIMVMSSNNWLGMWMGMEINLISFIPLIYMNKNSFSSQSMMMYFLTQSMGSMLFIMSMIMSSITNKNYYELFNSIMMISMMLKVGMAPFHFWLPEMMEKMNWMSCFILMTWQKIAPMMVLSQLIENKNWIYIMVIMSTIMGAIGGLNQTSVRKIMAYSSISHLGWMVACMEMENEMWIYYLLIYSMLIMTLTFMFNYYSIFFMNQLTTTIPSMMEKTLYATMILSLGGMPPFLGFLPKWLVIQSMMNKELYFMLIIMVMSTLLTLFYYLRMMSTMFMIYNMTNKIMIKLFNQKNNKIMIMTIIMNMMLPLMAMIFTN